MILGILLIVFAGLVVITTFGGKLYFSSQTAATVFNMAINLSGVAVCLLAAAKLIHGG